MTELTDRDRRIVALIDDGCNSEMIAEELDMSRWVLRDRIRDLRELLGASTMVGLPAALRAYDDEPSDADRRAS